MTTYKRIDTKNGRTQYWMDNKMVSVSDIPVSVASVLEPGVALEIGAGTAPVLPAEPTEAPELVKVKIDKKKCTICKKEATKVRFYNLQDIPVCDEHYAISLGNLAEKLRG